MELERQGRGRGDRSELEEALKASLASVPRAAAARGASDSVLRHRVSGLNQCELSSRWVIGHVRPQRVLRNVGLAVTPFWAP